MPGQQQTRRGTLPSSGSGCARAAFRPAGAAAVAAAGASPPARTGCWRRPEAAPAGRQTARSARSILARACVLHDFRGAERDSEDGRDQRLQSRFKRDISPHGALQLQQGEPLGLYNGGKAQLGRRRGRQQRQLGDASVAQGEDSRIAGGSERARGGWRHERDGTCNRGAGSVRQRDTVACRGGARGRAGAQARPGCASRGERNGCLKTCLRRFQRDTQHATRKYLEISESCGLCEAVKVLGSGKARENTGDCRTRRARVCQRAETLQGAGLQAQQQHVSGRSTEAAALPSNNKYTPKMGKNSVRR